MENEVVIVSAVRTAIGSFLGSLKDVSAADLGAIVIKEALERAGVHRSSLMKSLWGMSCKPGSDKIQRDKQQLKRDCQRQFLLWR